MLFKRRVALAIVILHSSRTMAKTTSFLVVREIDSYFSHMLSQCSNTKLYYIRRLLFCFVFLLFKQNLQVLAGLEVSVLLFQSLAIGGS